MTSTKFSSGLTLSTVILGLLLSCSLHATDRRFTYVYEATTTAKGEKEVENWATWSTQKHGSQRGNTFDFRTELEYGLTDNVQIGVYVADWQVQDSVAGDGRANAKYNDAAIELIRNLTSPTTDFFGSALYGEVQLGDQRFKMEGKLLLQKNIGPVVLAYNAILEAEWEGAQAGYYNEQRGTIGQTLGASYQFNPHFLFGGEFQQEIDLPGWKSANPSIIYAGPNASVRFGRYYLTTTAMIQATAISGAADFQLRTIFGFHF